MNESDLGNYYEILRCCDEVLDKVEHYGLDENSWVYNQYDRDSVLMTLGQVGESASHFKTNDYLALFPEIEWKRMKGMRNFIYHVYRRVDVYLTWNVICSDIPHLRNALLENAEIRAFYQEQVPVYEDLSLEQIQCLEDKNSPIAANRPSPDAPGLKDAEER